MSNLLTILLLLDCLLFGYLLDHFALVVQLLLVGGGSPYEIGLSYKTLYIAGSLGLLHDWRWKVGV